MYCLCYTLNIRCIVIITIPRLVVITRLIARLVVLWTCAVSVIIFTAEYLIRLYTCVENSEFKTKNGNQNQNQTDQFSRLKFIVSFYSVVDLLAIIPFFIDLVSTGSLHLFIFFFFSAAYICFTELSN